MTEPRATEDFETRFTGRVRGYTEPAATRRVDALAMSRTAMSSARTTGGARSWLGIGSVERPILDARLAVAVVAVVLIGVVGVALLGRLSDLGVGLQPMPAISPTPSPAAFAGGPVPDVLRHSWDRPYAVTPGLDRWPSGTLSLASGVIDVRTEPGSAAARSAITADLDTLEVTATVDTIGCATGEIGTYHWSLEGKDTVLTLTPIGVDACAGRQEMLAGQWVVRSPGGVAAVPPGTYTTLAFDPFQKPGVKRRLSYTLPEGWNVFGDEATTVTLHHQGQPPNDSFVVIFAQPRIASAFEAGAPCGPPGEAPGAGHQVDDIVAAIRARPGVVSTPPTGVTIGGYGGRMLDLHVAPSWTGGCRGSDGPDVSVPIIVQAGSGSGPVCGIGPGRPLRLILLDLTDGSTMAVGIFDPGAVSDSAFAEDVAAAMPIVESFEFHPPSP